MSTLNKALSRRTICTFFPAFCMLVLLAFPLQARMATPLEGSEKTADVPSVDKHFVRLLIQNNAEGGEKGWLFVERHLDKLPPLSLRQVKAMLVADMNREKSELVGPLPLDHRLAKRLLNAVDDRLGELNCDRIATGRLTEYNSSGASITYYTFMTKQKESLDVYISVSTLLPYYAYEENFDDTVSICLKNTSQNGLPAAGYIRKLFLPL